MTKTYDGKYNLLELEDSIRGMEKFFDNNRASKRKENKDWMFYLTGIGGVL